MKPAVLAGQQSSEDYFQKKGALLGQKAALNLWYVETRTDSQKQVCHIWLIKVFKICNCISQTAFTFKFQFSSKNRTKF